MRSELCLRLAVIFALLSVSSPLMAHPGSVGRDHCHICYDVCEPYGLKWGQRHCHPDRDPGIPASIDTHPGQAQVVPRHEGLTDQPAKKVPAQSQATAVVPQVFSATVIAVSAGDILTVSNAGGKRRVELYGIVAPRPGQPWAKQSLRFTKSQVYKKTITVIPKALTEESAISAEVILPDGQNLGHLLLQQGLARWDMRSTDAPILMELERTARTGPTGLWSD